MLGPGALPRLIQHSASQILPTASAHAPATVTPPAVIAAHPMSGDHHGAPAMPAQLQATSAPAHPGAHDVFEWLLSEPIGVLLVLPLALHFCVWRRQSAKAPGQPWMAWVAFASLLGVTLAIYSGFVERSFGVVHTTLLVLPPAIWLALEYELAFTLFGNVAVILLEGLGTGLGHGPFKDHSSGLPLMTVVYTLTTLMIAASSAERRQANSRIFQLATRDALTGLINRSTFLERAEQALAGAARYRHRLAVLFIDLDNFKVVNDTLGHHAGDQVLLEASRRILTCLRLDSTLARFGGDEMVALIDCAENDSALITIANRIADSMAKPFPLLGQDCQISCSIGISRFPEDADSVSELMMKADIAMYEVKTKGRNGFRIFCPDMHNFLDTKRRLPMTGEANPLSPPSPASTATA